MVESNIELVGPSETKLIDKSRVGELRIKAMKLIKPQDDRVLVILDDYLKETKGGIKLAETHSEQSRFGTIHSVGPVVEENGIYKPGDRIIVSFHAGIKVHLPAYYVTDDTFRILCESEILAKIDEEE